MLKISDEKEDIQWSLKLLRGSLCQLEAKEEQCDTKRTRKSTLSSDMAVHPVVRSLRQNTQRVIDFGTR